VFPVVSMEALARLRAELVLAALTLPAQPEVQEMIREMLLKLAATIEC
jgi:hypothetical protein